MSEERSSYFQELTLNLRQEGLTTGQPEDGLLPVEMEGKRLCLAMKSGTVRYWPEDVTDESRRAALDKVIDIARVTAEYMGRMETAPQLAVSSLKGDYRLLADFNGIILAGHPTEYGVQFVTWEQNQEGTSLNHGNYYGPACGVDSYAAAKEDFAIRSGLVPRSALFTPEQLTEVYRSIHETLDSEYPITEERKEHLRSAAEQIERGVPDWEERVALSEQKRSWRLPSRAECNSAEFVSN